MRYLSSRTCIDLANLKGQDLSMWGLKYVGIYERAMEQWLRISDFILKDNFFKYDHGFMII